MDTSIYPQRLETGRLHMQLEGVQTNTFLEIQLGTITIGMPPITKFRHNLTSLIIFYIWERKADAVMNLSGTRKELE
jgi:hypothetical protein